ncbi:MAG: OmpA family protein [Bacteroidia bacterium]
MKQFAATLLLIVSCALFSSLIPGRGVKANKTIHDTAFAVGDVIRIPEIPFVPSRDYGKMNQATKDSLDIVAAFLLSHAELTVELINHTDYRGSNKYNDRLSAERARVCVKYLVTEKKVPPFKITAKGASEYFLLNDEQAILNAKTKEEKKALHRMNVRTELVVRQVE